MQYARPVDISISRLRVTPNAVPVLNRDEPNSLSQCLMTKWGQKQAGAHSDSAGQGGCIRVE